MGAEGASRRRIATWAAVVCAATILLAIGGPLIGRGLLIGADVTRTVPPWDADTPTSFVYRHGGINDTVDSGAPAREAIRRTLVDDHRLALWDPYPNGGGPLASVPNSGTFAPINWPLFPLGVGHGLAWAALLRLAVAAIGMYFLLRWIGLSRFAGVCGGLIYCTSGFVIVWNNYPQADIAAMIPLLFLTADVLRERRRAINVVAVAAVVAAMLLEGYLPLVLVTLYALGAFLVVRWWDASRGDSADRPSLWSRLRTAVSPTASAHRSVRTGRGSRCLPARAVGARTERLRHHLPADQCGTPPSTGHALDERAPVGAGQPGAPGHAGRPQSGGPPLHRQLRRAVRISRSGRRGDGALGAAARATIARGPRCLRLLRCRHGDPAPRSLREPGRTTPRYRCPASAMRSTAFRG